MVKTPAPRLFNDRSISHNCDSDISLQKLFADDAKLDRGLGVEQFHISALNQIKQALRFLLGHDHDHQHGLFGLLKKTGGVNVPVTTKTFVGMNDGRAANTHKLCFFQQPLGNRLVLIAAVLQGIKIDLITGYGCLLGVSGQLPGHQTGDGGN